MGRMDGCPMSGGTGRSGAAFPFWLGQMQCSLEVEGLALLPAGVTAQFFLLPLLDLKDSLENAWLRGKREKKKGKQGTFS